MTGVELLKKRSRSYDRLFRVLYLSPRIFGDQTKFIFQLGFVIARQTPDLAFLQEIDQARGVQSHPPGTIAQ